MNPPPSRPPTSTSVSSSSITTLSSTLQSELWTKHSLPVSQTWLTTFQTTIKSPPPPLPALISTAHFRLLNSDFTVSLLSTSNSSPNSISPTASSQTITPLLLPQNITNPSTKSTTLQSNIPLQILNIQDTGSSRYAQIESIERIERGEEVKGREVIRVLPSADDEEGNSSSPSTSMGASTGINNATTNSTTSASAAPSVGTASIKKSQGPHKVLLQDASGTKIYGFELRTIAKIFVMTNTEEGGGGGGVSIGCKVMVKKGTVVRRGMIMLTPENVNVLGGKVEAWDKLWRGGRKERLKREMIEGLDGGNGNGED